MTTPFARSSLRRWLAGLLSLVIALGPLAPPSYAALTLLADEPLNVRNASKPNIVLTVDDSTSMLFDFLPDYIVNAYCRDGTGKMAAACGQAGMANDFSAAGYGRFLSPGYIAQQWKVPYTSYVSGSNYDSSGPGAGCDLTGFPPRCSGGVDPTANNTQPLGIERYPATSPRANMPYEYWTLWAAPVHNSAFNKLYYNPAITYDPPINADGTSFPQMDAGSTNNWTQVPADPWASTKVYVDLTSKVTVGQWCDSDWTQGTNPATGNPFATDPAFCRTNGVVAAASSGAPAAIGDYMYPWVPPGITVDGYTCPSGWTGPDNSVPPRCTLSGTTQLATPQPIWQKIAYSKVASGQPTAAFNASKDPKFFYENDNVIWCNPKSALWPQGGATQSQTCNGAQSQVCTGGTAQKCQGGTQQTCSAITQATT